MNNSDFLIRFLQQLNLSTEEVAILVALYQNGELSILGISRSSQVERGLVYRTIERLCERGLVEEESAEKGKVYRLADFEKINRLVNEEEQKVAFLKENLHPLKQMLQSAKQLEQQGTKVVFYNGKEGIKQIIWNKLRASKEINGFIYRDVTPYVGKTFLNNWYRELNLREIKFKALIGKEYLQSIGQTVEQVESISDEPGFTTRYLNPKDYDITFQIDIYNHVVAYYDWIDEKVFGVEIYNPKVADMQRFIFNQVWELSREVYKG